MVKKSERAAAALKRESNRQAAQLREAAMQSFLNECRASMPADDWEHYYDDASRSAGETFHIVEHLIFVLASKQLPISARLRKSIDAMLDVLGIDRRATTWKDLARLNYGKYWQARYGYV